MNIYTLNGKAWKKTARNDLPSFVCFNEGIEWNEYEIRQDTKKVMSTCAKLLNKIVPRAAVYLVPSLINKHHTNVPFKSFAGLACSEENTILISFHNNTAPWDIIGTCLHEAYHIVDLNILSCFDKEIVNSSLDGIALPDGYYNSKIERSARAFEAFALHQLSLSAVPEMPWFWRYRSTEIIFWEILTGTYNPKKEDNCISLFISDFLYLASFPRMIKKMVFNKLKSIKWRLK